MFLKFVMHLHRTQGHALMIKGNIVAKIKIILFQEIHMQNIKHSLNFCIWYSMWTSRNYSYYFYSLWISEQHVYSTFRYSGSMCMWTLSLSVMLGFIYCQINRSRLLRSFNKCVITFFVGLVRMEKTSKTAKALVKVQ